MITCFILVWFHSFFFFFFFKKKENGLGTVPAMGYNTWNDLQCQNMNEAAILNVFNVWVAQGMHKLGYRFINLDDCWQAQNRSSDGSILADPVRFPRGIKFLADEAHSRGLLFGIYTDRGTMTCQKRPGSLGFEIKDALTYADWGIDYVKEDSCYATQNHSIAFEQYAKMRDSLNATGRPMLFSLCGWRDWYAPAGASLGNSWRISPDVRHYQLRISCFLFFVFCFCFCFCFFFFFCFKK